jgi:hypothetical protein
MAVRAALILLVLTALNSNSVRVARELISCAERTLMEIKFKFQINSPAMHSGIQRYLVNLKVLSFEVVALKFSRFILNTYLLLSGLVT